ncbi:MAG: arsenosugar biosynthesis radical SAM (seleno)protein ArsS [Syntrophobacteraceae bacterium]
MDPRQQLAMLEIPGRRESFVERLKAMEMFPLCATGVAILQLNITRRCNLTCRHCHVEASPDRLEMMSAEVIAECVRIAHISEIDTIDVTGGAPELHPQLPRLLRELAATGKRIIVRTNLAVLTEGVSQTFPQMYRELGVEIVGSLPDYTSERTDRQRGSGTFARCITAIGQLNKIGYGREGTGLVLNLMHNPSGAFMPGNQSSLEHEYKRRLREGFGVAFNGLFVLTNCPIGRYLDYLISSDNLNDYMAVLASAFNPAAVSAVMCRNTLSVSWDGRLYDCDFNQMLGLKVNGGSPTHIREFDIKRLSQREIIVRNHCFACCAGAGSSCQGVLDT